MVAGWSATPRETYGALFDGRPRAHVAAGAA